MTKKIAILDYEAGNLKSVAKALEHVGATVEVTRDPKKIASAAKIVLPGVGSFGHCMGNLTRFDLVDVVKCEIKNGKSFLGICLGMQMLFDESEESPGVTGLGILPGVVKKFDFTNDQKIPHMGWNEINILGRGRSRATLSLFAEIPNQSHFYFVHSFYVKPADAGVIAATTDYGFEFCSAVAHENIFACQFHPEKSQKIGLNLLQNFINFT